MEMNCPASLPFAEKEKIGFKITATISVLSDFGNTNSFIKIKLYVHSIRTKLTRKVLSVFQSNTINARK